MQGQCLCFLAALQGCKAEVGSEGSSQRGLKGTWPGVGSARQEGPAGHCNWQKSRPQDRTQELVTVLSGPGGKRLLSLFPLGLEEKGESNQA